jgi:hypothetical protein
MKRIVPSTRGDLCVKVERKDGARERQEKGAKFMHIRPIVDTFVKEWDTPENPVVSVTIMFRITGSKR